MSTYSKGSIAASAAKKAIDAAVAKAEENGVAISVAVCDESGHLKAFHRMDGASFAAGKIAEDKAYTAAAFGVPTDQWYSILQGDAPLHEGMLNSIERLCTLGGGVAIMADGGIAGAVGVSGGTYQQDHDAAEAGVAAANA